MVERSGAAAIRTCRAEAQGICSRSPFELQWPVPYGKSNLLHRCEWDGDNGAGTTVPCTGIPSEVKVSHFVLSRDDEAYGVVIRSTGKTRYLGLHFKRHDVLAIGDSDCAYC
jgi:hypothetical protein